MTIQTILTLVLASFVAQHCLAQNLDKIFRDKFPGFHLVRCSKSHSCQHILTDISQYNGTTESLAVLANERDNSKQLLAWIQISPNGEIYSKRAKSLTRPESGCWSLTALTPNALSQYQSSNEYIASNTSNTVHAPIEYHLDELDQGLSSQAELFSPSFGIALVVNGLVDDRKNPAPIGQEWATHARGESTDLPVTQFAKAKILGASQGRVWFRLNKRVYVADRDSWVAWRKQFNSSIPARLTIPSTTPPSAARTQPLRGRSGYVGR